MYTPLGTVKQTIQQCAKAESWLLKLSTESDQIASFHIEEAVTELRAAQQAMAAWVGEQR